MNHWRWCDGSSITVDDNARVCVDYLTTAVHFLIFVKKKPQELLLTFVVVTLF